MQKRGILAVKGKQDQLVQAKKMSVKRYYKYKKTIPERGGFPMKQRQSLVQTNMSVKHHKERQRMLLQDGHTLFQ